MRQLMIGADDRLEWVEAPSPTLIDASDALVRPVALSICDADVLYLRGRLPRRQPFCFGHEFVADVVSVGDAVVRFAPGARVIVAFKIACGRCERCRAGFPIACTIVPLSSAFGFGIFGDWGGAGCDLIRVPFADYMMQPLPDGVPATLAASAGDNLSDAFRCVVEGLEETPGAPVLVVGGGGGVPSVALYAAAAALALGSEQVDYLDRDPVRLGIAEALGANAIEVGEVPRRHGAYLVTVDANADASGEWLATTLRSTAPYGRCTSCGVYHGVAPAPLGDMYRQGVRFTLGWPNVHPVMPRVLALLADRRLDIEKIHTVAAWDDAIAALEEPPAKLVLARPELLR